MNTGNPAKAAAVVSDRLQGCCAVWVIGGSTGLAVRGARLERPPRDLDIYADDHDIAAIHKRLTEYAVDTPMPNETDRYSSTLAHYAIEGTVVELVGGFVVRAGGSTYRTEVRDMLAPYADDFVLDGRAVQVVPLAHELLFNVLRERDDRVTLIGTLIRDEPDRHVPILSRLLLRNELAAEAKDRIRRVLAAEGSRLKAAPE